MQELLSVLFHKDDLSGSLAVLDKMESSFYKLILKLKRFKATDLDLQQEIGLLNIRTASLPHSLTSVAAPRPPSGPEEPRKRFDTSVLEPSRLPNAPKKSFLEKLKSANQMSASATSLMLKVRDTYLIIMMMFMIMMIMMIILLKVRDSYLPNNGQKRRLSYDKDKRVIPKEGKRRSDPILGPHKSFEKKLSVDSTASSHASRSIMIMMPIIMMIMTMMTIMIMLMILS